MPRYIGTCFRFHTQMRVEKKKAFAYRIYSHFTQQCPGLNISLFLVSDSENVVVPLELLTQYPR